MDLFFMSSTLTGNRINMYVIKIIYFKYQTNRCLMKQYKRAFIIRVLMNLL